MASLFFFAQHTYSPYHAAMLMMLFILMMLTLFVMIAGVVLMMKGGAINEKYGNKLMIARVSLQGLCIAMVGILFLTQ